MSTSTESKPASTSAVEAAKQARKHAEQALTVGREALHSLNERRQQIQHAIQTGGQPPKGHTFASVNDDIAVEELRVTGLQNSLTQADEALNTALADDVEQRVREQINPLRTVDQNSPHIEAMVAAINSIASDTAESNAILANAVADLKAAGDTFVYKSKWEVTPTTERLHLTQAGTRRAGSGIVLKGEGTYDKVPVEKAVADAIITALIACGFRQLAELRLR